MHLADLYEFLPELEGRLARSYAAQRPTVPGAVRPYAELARRFTLRGGKRFRALLVLGGFYIGGGRSLRTALPAAAGLEHFQSWMLIHDDIIDHARERRGGPSLHLELASRAAPRQSSAGAADFGSGVALTLGDLEEPYAVGGLLEMKVDDARKLEALAEYVRMTRLTAYGQLLDIRNATVAPGQLTPDDVLTVHRLKSAVYTVAAPLGIGARLAGGSASLLRELDGIATDLGIAFQLRDDVLGAGLGGSEVGKSANDLVEGKRTLLVVELWARGSPSEKAAVAAVLGDGAASRRDLERAREAIRSSGSLEVSERTIARLTRRALRRLDRSRTIQPGAKPLLREIAERLTQRDS